MAKNISDFSMMMLSQMVYIDIDANSGLSFIYDKDELNISTMMSNKKVKDYFYSKNFTQSQIDQFIKECGEYKISNNSRELCDNKNMLTNDSCVLNDNGSGYCGLIVEISDEEAIIVSRGSEKFFENLEDWENNATLMYKVQTAQHQFLQDKIDSGLFKDYSILHATGHSLGGNNALYLSTGTGLEFGEKVVDVRVFNAPGFCDEYIEANREQIALMGPMITEFRNEDDIVSGILNNLTDPVYVNNTNYVSVLGHDLSQLDVNPDGSMKKTIFQKPGTIPIITNIITNFLDTLPGGMSKFIIETAFSFLWGNTTWEDWVTAGIVLAVALKNLDTLLILGRIVLLVVGLEYLSAQVELKFEEFCKWFKDTIKKVLEKLDLLKDIFIETASWCLDELKNFGNYIEQLFSDFIQFLENSWSNFWNNLWNNESKNTSYGEIEIDFNVISNTIDKLRIAEGKVYSIKNRLSYLNKLIMQQAISLSIHPVYFNDRGEINKVITYLNDMMNEFNDCEAKNLKNANLFL